ncbi:MAG: efflux RND transporter periplasmic adaptor subunit [Thermodesulfobacteriota bacterium]
MKKWIFMILVISMGIGFILYFFNQKKETEYSFIRVSGNIETTEVNVGFKISGRIISLPVQEGDWVERDQIIARLEDEDLQQRLTLAKATLLSAQARLNKLLAGSRPEEVREAEAVLQQARFDLENKQAHYERMKSLFERGVIPKETLDNSETAYKIARAGLQRATENYQLVKEGPRKEDIEDARAQVEQAKANLRLIETQIRYTLLTSPISGMVLVKSAEVGEVVNPGTTVLTLAEIEKVWLKAYISETDLGRVKWGQEVRVTTDLHPKKEYIGRISFISSSAEFTPKQIQTEKERVTLVYRIKIDISNPERELKPGMPADGRILLGPASLSSNKNETK